MSQQQTIGEAIHFSGTGLHGGHRVNMSFLPAPPNSGVRFRRVDLEGKPEVEARVEHVSETNRSTTLAKGNIKIHTVEHVLATFAGFGIDNGVIELDASEPPVGDGSARAYCRMIETAGIVAQSEPRQPFQVNVPMELQLGESSMAVFPHDRLKISCTSTDRRARFTQFYSVELSPESWEKEIASARTFCFYEEIEFLIKNGLIRGGSLENAVVIREDAVLTTEPLRYPDEFVRHKILDIIGDLALLGRPVQGHIIAVKPSHAANCELARQLGVRMQKLAAPDLVLGSPGPAGSAGGTGSVRPADTMEEPVSSNGSLDIQGIMRLLPHRPPFLMVDRVLRLEGNQIRAIKNVTMNEGHFLGHFPGFPIMPGVLQLEAMAQAAGLLMLTQLKDVAKLAYFMSAEKVKWRKPVYPGDRLIIDVELTKFRGKIGKAKGVCTVGGEEVSEAAITLMLTES